ncbi:hypothetical protein EDD90_3278 [Streptomyces sp. Ag109_O5-1]|uniref:hypothetical protein n=1 Tax=Streptomyces sp. Ag109_O5-1 TaxID=1938851 RepID=UPI000F50E14D|nr:hypothetical protein [Streptomyces sp. Ag109_O5-1]RPE40242.1 hypothetical protein EDD90_3278 [Streptomyces sp. Ag109_O5-1]
MTDQPKRITIDAPDGLTILAARHLDATEGRVQVGTAVDTATRTAITRVLAYVAKAHNSRPTPTADRRAEPSAEARELMTQHDQLDLANMVVALHKLEADARAERDTARQHAAAIAGQRDRLRQRMNALADRWEHALAVDKPYACTLREEISCDPYASVSMAVHQYRADDGAQRWAARCWGTETCDGWLSLGHDTQRWAEIVRDRHVAEEHAALDEPAPEPAAEDLAATILRIHALAEQHPVAIPTHLVDAALDQPAPEPAATEEH